MRIKAAIAIAVLAALGGCGGNGSSSGEGGGSTAESRGGSTISSRGGKSDGKTPSTPPPKCRQAEISKAKTAGYGAPSQTVEKEEKLTAVVKTNCGAFSISLDTKHFPTVVNSFVFLAKHDFFDGVPFGEAGAGRYLHGGDPPGAATGPGYTVKERVPSEFIYRRGVVAMEEPGEAGYEKAGSRFFIVLAKPWLDFSGVFPPVGTVETGFGVLNGISQLGPHSEYFNNVGVLGPVGKLRRPVVIEDIEIEKG